MMESKKSFSLRSLFLWCSIAAALLAVVGLGYRGIDWAVGASWALLAALITMVTISILYWLAYYVAVFIDRIVSGVNQRTTPIAQTGTPQPNPAGPDEITVNIAASEETRI